MEIGTRIKTLRKSIGLTQEELGELLGVKKAAVQKYENGVIINLKVDTIQKLGAIFKVSPAYIMGWDKFDEEYDTEEIKREIKIAELLSEVYEERDQELIDKTLLLNNDGRNQLHNYVNDLIEIKKYQK